MHSFFISASLLSYNLYSGFPYLVCYPVKNTFEEWNLFIKYACVCVGVPGSLISFNHHWVSGMYMKRRAFPLIFLSLSKSDIFGHLQRQRTAGGLVHLTDAHLPVYESFWTQSLPICFFWCSPLFGDFTSLWRIKKITRRWKWFKISPTVRWIQISGDTQGKKTCTAFVSCF